MAKESKKKATTTTKAPEHEERAEDKKEETAVEEEEPYQARGILAALLNAVMKPGTAHIIRVLIHVSFVGLLLVLAGVLFVLPRDSPVRIHVVLLALLTAGLYALIVWFLSTGIADPPKDKKDEDAKDAAADKKQKPKKEDKKQKSPKEADRKSKGSKKPKKE